MSLNFDGFGGGVGAYKEKTQSANNNFSVLAVWFRGHTKIGFVRQVKVTYDSEQFKIENQVKSMKNVDQLVPERRHLSRQNKKGQSSPHS